MLSDAHFMDIAYIIGSAGTCSRLQVGAVVVRDRRIISTGYNGAPANMPHCDHTDPGLDPRGPDPACRVAVHAEANAIAYAARRGQTTDFASLYVTNSPCQKCAELIINAGIREVIYDQAYRIKDGLELLAQAHIHTLQVNRSLMRTLSAPSRDGESMYPSQHADEAFDAGWQAQADAHHRGSTGIQ